VSPQNPSGLVVLELFKQSTQWLANADYWRPGVKATGNISLAWLANECTSDQVPLAGGAVCATIPHYFVRDVQEVGNLEVKENKLRWRGAGITLIIVLPYGWVMDPGDGDISPTDVKRHNDQFAAYWDLDAERECVDWGVTALVGMRRRKVRDAIDRLVRRMRGGE
jgi:hypothetical protein